MDHKRAMNVESEHPLNPRIDGTVGRTHIKD